MHRRLSAILPPPGCPTWRSERHAFQPGQIDGLLRAPEDDRTIRSMPKILTLLYGLPGAGKTTLISDFEARGYQIFDDFMLASRRNQRSFLACRYLADIVHRVRKSEPCAIADIRLCHKTFREEVALELQRKISDIRLEWHCFDCRTPEIADVCRHNVRHRAWTCNCDESHALRWIDTHWHHFSVEPGANIHHVVRARSE